MNISTSVTREQILHILIALDTLTNAPCTHSFLHFRCIIMIMRPTMPPLFDLSHFAHSGSDIRVSAHASFTRPDLARLGSHVAIDPYFHCTTALETGDYVHISSHVSIIGGKDGLLKMGNFTNISTHGVIVCGSDAFKGEGIVSAPNLPQEYRDTVIIEPVIFEDFANTGARVTILPGVVLPQGVVIGAHSLVRKKDILQPWRVYAGNPLREIDVRPREKMLEYAKRLGY